MIKTLRESGCRIVFKDGDYFVNAGDIGKTLTIKSIRNSISRNVQECDKLILSGNQYKKYKHEGFRGPLNNRGEVFLRKSAVIEIASLSRKLSADKFLADIGVRREEAKPFCKEGKFIKLLNSYLNIIESEYKKVLGYDLGNIYKYEMQYPVGGKRLDLYFKAANLVVEYDEYQHRYNAEYDRERESYIESNFGKQVEWIRVEQGFELKGVIKIIGALQAREILSTINDFV